MSGDGKRREKGSIICASPRSGAGVCWPQAGPELLEVKAEEDGPCLAQQVRVCSSRMLSPAEQQSCHSALLAASGRHCSHRLVA